MLIILLIIIVSLFHVFIVSPICAIIFTMRRISPDLMAPVVLMEDMVELALSFGHVNVIYINVP